MTRLLIIKPSSLGDVVHALPVLARLRQALPTAAVDWLVKAQWAPLLERVQGLDHIWRIPPGVRGWLSMIPSLRSVRYDVVVDLQGLLRSAAMAWATGAARRIGFANAREGSPWFYTERVAVPTLEMHAVDRYLLVANAVVPALDHLPARFGLQSRGEDREAVAQLLHRVGLLPGGPWIAVNPAARWRTKRWPAEAFARTADRIQEAGWARIALIGSADDRLVTQAVQHAMKTTAIDLTGTIPLALLPALLETASLLITNDSGPMHIAVAVGTPVVALFGPTSPARTGPYGSGHVVLQEGLSCTPCFSRHCSNPRPLECLERLSPEQVVEAVGRRLQTIEAKALRR